MPERQQRDRGHTIPRQAWWCEAATAAADASGLTREQLAAAIFDRFGYEASTTKLIRTLRGDILTWDLAVHVSAMFGLPRPLIEVSTMDEALQLLAQRELHRVRLQVGVLSAGVPSAEKPSQGVAVQHGDGGRVVRKRRRVGGTSGA